jgi:hypothetical protein
MSGKDYFRPRGDITTVLDLTDRDAQDNTYFPLDTEESWFHREERTVYPTTMSIQEFTQRGPADWGQTFSFEIGSLPAGDLLQSVILQFKLGSWYNNGILQQLSKGQVTASVGTIPNATNYSAEYWTYCNSLGTSIIEHAEFIVNDQTIERLSGEFIRSFLNIYADINTLSGISVDAIGTTPYSYLSNVPINGAIPVMQTTFSPNRPFPTEDGTYFCILPFFFLRTRLKQVFPLLSCNEGNVRINVTLRPFEQVVRKFIGYRANCNDVPLNKSVSFITTPLEIEAPQNILTTTTSQQPPEFLSFRILTFAALTTGTIRDKFLRQPFEQMIKTVQSFHFDEPLKYLVSKPNPNSDSVDIQLPLELNHPVIELIWVLRRKAVLINNEWSNFSPSIGLEQTPEKVYPPWLQTANIRINGSEVISAPGNWFREHIAKAHKGGLITYQSHVYGYSFARYPDEHQPSGTANMSRATSVTLTLKVNTPIPVNVAALDPPCVFDPAVVGGWEVFVHAIHYNWLRFENGICNRVFTD